MSLEEIRKKNRLKDSIIYAKVEYDIPKEVANSIKNDVFHGFIEPLGEETLRRYCEITEEE